MGHEDIQLRTLILRTFVSVDSRVHGRCIDNDIRWPVRTLSFSYDGQFIASASEDSFIDIVSWRKKHTHGIMLTSTFLVAC